MTSLPSCFWLLEHANVELCNKPTYFSKCKSCKCKAFSASTDDSWAELSDRVEYNLHFATALNLLNPFQASFFCLQQQPDLLQFVVSVQAANAMIHKLQERECEAKKVKDGWMDRYLFCNLRVLCFTASLSAFSIAKLKNICFYTLYTCSKTSFGVISALIKCTLQS